MNMKCEQMESLEKVVRKNILYALRCLVLKRERFFKHLHKLLV